MSKQSDRHDARFKGLQEPRDAVGGGSTELCTNDTVTIPTRPMANWYCTYTPGGFGSTVLASLAPASAVPLGELQAHRTTAFARCRAE